MADLKKRFSSQGITLEQFAFQFVVILLGVYLAIAFEARAEDRSREADAENLLLNVLSELTSDELELEDALQAQRSRSENFAVMADLLATASEKDEPAIDSLRWSFSRTAFPRRSAYTALLASGNLGYISDRELALQLVDLYEHHYARLNNQGQVLDELVVDWFPVEAEYWDRAEGRLVQTGAEANIVHRNWAASQSRYAGFYVARVEETLVALREVKERLDLYLEG